MRIRPEGLPIDLLTFVAFVAEFVLVPNGVDAMRLISRLQWWLERQVTTHRMIFNVPMYAGGLAACLAMCLVLLLVLSEDIGNQGGVSIDNGETLRLSGASGGFVRFEMYYSGLSDNWASSTGITLTLDGDAASTMVVNPRTKNWTNSVKIYPSQSSSVDRIQGSFSIPRYSAPFPRTITGIITGEVEYPVGAERGGFRDQRRNLEIPVILEVGSPEEAERLKEANREIYLLPIELLLYAVALSVPYSVVLLGTRYCLGVNLWK